MSLRDEVKNENNTPFSIQICCGYNNAANTLRIYAAMRVLEDQVTAHLRRQNKGADKSIAEEAILQARYLYCRGDNNVDP